jgi:hypothetical protein
MSKAPALLALLALVVPGALTAQVGHDPAHSPYRPITTRSSLMVTAGYLSGSGGKLGIGPSDGPLFGLRYELRLTGPTDAHVGVAWSRLQRLIADPSAPTDEQISGPVKQSVIFADAGLSILLTGDKTWNRLAPYFGASLGLAFGSSVPSDSSGFRFNAKFVTGPHVGIRFYPASGLTFRAEGRLLFWQLKYPSPFFSNPSRAPTDPPILDPLTNSDKEWTTHPTIMIALGYAFRF